jgi:hypothetical protein
MESVGPFADGIPIAVIALRPGAAIAPVVYRLFNLDPGIEDTELQVRIAEDISFSFNKSFALFRLRSHRLPEHRVHGAKELAKFPHEAEKWQLPFDRIQVLELHLGVMYTGVPAKGGVQSP